MMWLTMGRGTPHNQNRKCKKPKRGKKNPTRHTLRVISQPLWLCYRTPTPSCIRAHVPRSAGTARETILLLMININRRKPEARGPERLYRLQHGTL